MCVAAQSIPLPTSRGRSAGDHRTGVHKRVGWVVVDRLCVHAAHDRDPIGYASGYLWENSADFLTTLTKPLEGVLGRKTLERLALQLRDLLSLGKALWHWLAIEFGQPGLVVKRVKVRHATGHIKPDHSLGFGGHMKGLDGARPDSWVQSCGRCFCRSGK